MDQTILKVYGWGYSLSILWIKPYSKYMGGVAWCRMAWRACGVCVARRGVAWRGTSRVVRGAWHGAACGVAWRVAFGVWRVACVACVAWCVTRGIWRKEDLL